MIEPKLRFKADDGSQFPDWEEKRLEEIVGKISSGKDKACNGNYVLYGSTGIIGTCQSPTYKGRKILVARVGANAGTVNLVNDDCGVSDNTLIINNVDLCNFDWLYFYMVHKELGKMRFGSGQPLITGTMLRDLCIQLPNDFEQQKIAEFLSTIDTVIAKQKETVSAWEERKKGVMQKLFSQEVRFKADDGSDFPEWAEKKLGDDVQFLNGRAYKQDELLMSGKYLVLRVGNLFTNDSYYYSDLELDDDKYIENGNLIYAWSATFGPRIYHGKKCIYHYHIWKLKFDENAIFKMFLNYCLLHDVENIKSQRTGGTMVHITKNAMENRKLYFPCLAEQQKIADCLSSLDEVIEKQKATLAAWEELKIGLLQQMFV